MGAVGVEKEGQMCYYEAVLGGLVVVGKVSSDPEGQKGAGHPGGRAVIEVERLGRSG